MGGIPFLGSCDAVVPVYDRRFDAVFTVKVRRYVRQLLARLSEDSEAGISAVYFRNDCALVKFWILTAAEDASPARYRAAVLSRKREIKEKRGFKNDYHKIKR